MSRNVDFEALSAYADGELSPADNRKTYKHLRNHDKHSALLILFDEITASVSETAEPVPDGLCSGIMDKIKSGDVEIALPDVNVLASGKPLHKPKGIIDRRIVITRIMPVAACLAVTLLVWGVYRGIDGTSGRDAMNPTLPGAALQAEPEAVIDTAADAGSGAGGLSEEAFSVGFDDAAPAEAASGLPPGTERRDAGGGLFSAESDGSIKAYEDDSYSKITPEEAFAIMNKTGQYVILDVRTEDEYLQSRISGAVLLPHTDISAGAADILPDFHELIFVYCQSGIRSAAASEILAKMGYTQVYDIGGIIDWPYETVS